MPNESLLEEDKKLLNATFEQLIDQVNDGLTEVPFDSLLTLKAMHRQMIVQLQTAEASFQEAAKRKEKSQQQLDALRYERRHLEQQIEDCQSFATPHLIRMAKEEHADLDEEAALREFLGAEMNEPAQRQTILARLHKELNTRGGLERDLQVQQKALQELKQSIAKKKQFLSTLPDHLGAMERASLPLQKLIPLKIGTERKARLDAAKDLPPPLYTLFQTLQNYVDQKNNDGIGVSIANSAPSDKQVLLLLPVPVGSGRSKRVTVHFHFDENEGLVSAVASGCGSSLFQDLLLQELFPNDNPAPVADQQHDRRPYHWCNVLSGVYRADGRECVDASTRVVLRELQRRVRANAVLKQLLHSLPRGHVPSPPNDDRFTAPKCKLMSFESDAKEKMVERDFTVKLRKGTASTLTVRVEIHMARYPSIPPVWKLQQQDGLYDARLAQLEHSVNVDLLERTTDHHEHILLLQLHEVMHEWASLEEEGAPGSTTRKRKGRDRVAVEQNVQKKAKT